MASACIGGGGQDGWLSLSASEILNAFGYAYDSSDPLTYTYPIVAKRYNPYASGSKWYGPFNNFAEACMRSRAILFCNQSPGDCGVSSQSLEASNTAQFVGQIGSTGIEAAQTVGTLAKLTGTAASILGSVTAGAGFVLSAIVSAFQRHAQAVANQSHALCELAPEMTQNIAEIDASVAAGRDSATDAANAIAQLAAEFQNAIASLEKNCNAFCMYHALIECVSAITPYYYEALPPLPPPASAVAPSIPAPAGSTPIVSPVMSTSGAGLFQPQPKPAPAPATLSLGMAGSGPMWMFIAAAIVLLIFFVRG